MSSLTDPFLNVDFYRVDIAMENPDKTAVTWMFGIINRLLFYII